MSCYRGCSWRSHQLCDIVKELLSDDYVITNKFKVSSKTEDGISYTITGVKSKDDAIDAEVSAKLNLKGAAVTPKLFTGGKEPTAELKYETKDAQDRKVAFTGLAGRSVATSAIEFTGGPLGIKVAADFLKSDLYGSAAVALSSAKFSGFAVVGAEAEYSMTDKTVTSTNYALSFFDGKESECTLHVLDKARKGMISYSHHVRPGFSVGAQMIYVRESKETALVMGTAYRLDGATTVKAKLGSEGSLSLSYIQDIRPNTTLIMSSKFDTKKFDSAKVGISVTVE